MQRSDSPSSIQDLGENVVTLQKFTETMPRPVCAIIKDERISDFYLDGKCIYVTKPSSVRRNLTLYYKQIHCDDASMGSLLMMMWIH